MCFPFSCHFTGCRSFGWKAANASSDASERFCPHQHAAPLLLSPSLFFRHTLRCVSVCPSVDPLLLHPSQAERAHQGEHFCQQTMWSNLSKRWLKWLPKVQNGSLMSSWQNMRPCRLAHRVYKIFSPYLASQTRTTGIYTVKISALRDTIEWVKMETKVANYPTFGSYFGQQRSFEGNKCLCFLMFQTILKISIFGTPQTPNWHPWSV